MAEWGTTIVKLCTWLVSQTVPPLEKKIRKNPGTMYVLCSSLNLQITFSHFFQFFTHKLKCLVGDPCLSSELKFIVAAVQNLTVWTQRRARPPCRSRALISRGQPSSWQISATVFCNTPVFDNNLLAMSFSLLEGEFFLWTWMFCG